MARAATAGELANFRKEGQRAALYLAIEYPRVIYSAQVNGTPSSLDRLTEIVYDNGSGTLANVKAGMTLWIGTTSGGYDVGMARVRKAPSATIMYIGEESELNISNDQYLTVVQEVGIWARHWTVEGGTIIVDVDNEYSDQHSSPDPVPVLGPDAVLKLEESTVDHTRDASGSFVIGSTISSHSWGAIGPAAVSISGGSTATPTLTFSVVGSYLIWDTVTSAAGKSTTGYRSVYIHSDASPPSTVFNLERCEGSFEQGGWSFEVTMWDEADQATEIRDRAKVILFSDDWYGATKTSIGPIAEHENIVAVGWIDGESIIWNPELGSVTFTVRGPNFWLDKIGGFPAGVEDSNFADNGGGVPDRWTEFQNLTVDKGLWHFLHWRSTATLCIDIYLTGDTKESPSVESPMGSLWQQLVTMSDAYILARPLCDRYGRLFIEIDSNYIPVADRSSIPTVQALTGGDWHGDLEVVRRTVPEAGYLDFSGVAYSSSTGETSPFFSLSPGTVMKRFGKPYPKDKLLLADQAQANELCGLLMGSLNNPYPSIPIQLASNHRLVDIAPIQYLEITIASSDTVRGITATALKIIPRVVSFDHEPDTGVFLTNVECEGASLPELSITVKRSQPPTPGLPPIPGLPVWPIVPPPITIPPSPWVPQPPPTLVCNTDFNAPPNGPFAMWTADKGGTLQNNMPFGNSTAAVTELNYYIRSVSHVNQTYVVLEGCWEQSLDGGGSWQTWEDLDGFHIYANLINPATTEEADNTIFTGKRCEPRGGYITPLDPAVPNYFIFQVDPSQGFIAGPATVTIEAVFNATKLSEREFRADTITGACATGARAIWKIIYSNWAALGNGALHATIEMYDVDPDGNTINPNGYDTTGDGFTPFLTLTGQQYFGVQTHELVSNTFTPAGDTYHMGFCVTSGLTGETAWFRLLDLFWKRASDGLETSLWTPEYIEIIKRVRFDDGFIYNICTE